MQKCLIVTGCDWRCVDVYDDIGALNASFKELFFSNVIFVPSGSFSRAIFLPSPAVQSSTAGIVVAPAAASLELKEKGNSVRISSQHANN